MHALYGHISPNSVSSPPVFDRFIPSRTNLDAETSHHRLSSFDSEDVEKQPAQYRNEEGKRYNDILAEALGKENGKVLPTTAQLKRNTEKSKFDY